MNARLTCGRCKRRWPYVGAAPWDALRDHNATEHPPPGVVETPAELEQSEPEEETPE